MAGTGLSADPAEYRARALPGRYVPMNMVPIEQIDEKRAFVSLPPLIKGYLRLGAYICGEPAWDAEFNTADLFILLPISRMSGRYAKHFLKTSEHFLKM